MTGALIVTHGNLAYELLNAASGEHPAKRLEAFRVLWERADIREWQTALGLAELALAATS